MTERKREGRDEGKTLGIGEEGGKVVVATAAFGGRFRFPMVAVLEDTGCSAGRILSSINIIFMIFHLRLESHLHTFWMLA